VKRNQADYPVATLCRTLGGLHQWLLRVAESSGLGTGAVRCPAERADPGTASALAWQLWILVEIT